MEAGPPAAVERGDPQAAEQLLPLVYDELRKLAAARMAEEKPGQTLQPTALVHEAYVRLVGGEQPQSWDGRGLVDHADRISTHIKNTIGISSNVRVVAPETLERSLGKAKRVYDKRPKG